jgi:hypothetical protein
MVEKFDRMQISAINDNQESRVNRKKGAANGKTIAVPEKETFKHVFENAKKGNEMAAVLLDEWQKNCTPRDNKEEQIIQMINMAAGKIFE